MKKLIIFLLLLPFASIGQGNFFMTHTNITVQPCGTVLTYTGGQSYPTQITVDIGVGTGVVTFTYNAYDKPDYFKVDFDGSTVINLPYRGNAFNYTYGAPLRTDFNSSLTGKTEPFGVYTYPNFVQYTQDGYPLVINAYGNYTATFNKTTSTRYATVTIYAPMGETAWSVSLSCLN